MLSLKCIHLSTIAKPQDIRYLDRRIDSNLIWFIGSRLKYRVCLGFQHLVILMNEGRKDQELLVLELKLAAAISDAAFAKQNNLPAGG